MQAAVLSCGRTRELPTHAVLTHLFARGRGRAPEEARAWGRRALLPVTLAPAPQTGPFLRRPAQSISRRKRHQP